MLALIILVVKRLELLFDGNELLRPGNIVWEVILVRFVLEGPWPFAQDFNGELELLLLWFDPLNLKLSVQLNCCQIISYFQLDQLSKILSTFLLQPLDKLYLFSQILAVIRKQPMGQILLVRSNKDVLTRQTIKHCENWLDILIGWIRWEMVVYCLHQSPRYVEILIVQMNYYLHRFSELDLELWGRVEHSVC